MVNLPLANLAYEILTCLVLSLIHLNLPSYLLGSSFSLLPLCYALSADGPSSAPTSWQAGEGGAPLWGWASAHT